MYRQLPILTRLREKIVCKLINEEANQQFLQDKPYSKLENLAVVYQILMDKTGEGTATITITDNLMDMESHLKNCMTRRYRIWILCSHIVSKE